MRELIFYSFLASLAIPNVLLLIPQYLLLDRLHLLDSLVGLVFLYVSANLPFMIFFLRGFFAGIPREYEEAFRLDGASTLEVIVRLIAPLSLPALAVVSMFTFSFAWDEFPLALTMLTTPSHFTLPIGLADFIGEHTTAWGPFFAASVIATVPVVIIVPNLSALGPQRDLARGPALSAARRAAGLLPLGGRRSCWRQLPPGTSSVVARRARGDAIDAEPVQGRPSSGNLPSGTYSVEALGENGAVLAEELTTVGAHPGERPVHGFATSFQDGDVPAVLEWLRALRCTVVQIYDWMASYSAPLGPAQGWNDPPGRPVSYTALRSLAAGIRGPAGPWRTRTCPSTQWTYLSRPLIPSCSWSATTAARNASST